MEKWQENALVNIVSVLDGADMSQAEFARKAKINAKHLNSVLKGHRPVTRQLVATIADYLKRDTDWFWQDHSPKAAPSHKANDDLTFSDAVAILERFRELTPLQRKVMRAVLFRDPSILEGEKGEVVQLVQALAKGIR